MSRSANPNRPPVSTKVEVEKVFLVGLQTGEMKRAEAEASLEELTRLAESTRCEIVGETLLHVRQPKAGTFLPEGQVETVAGLVAAIGADTVILDEDVSPTQQRNLGNRWDAKVLTRSELILDIFAGRAHTSEGKLQVELAQLQFRLPRLRGFGTALSRLGGGIGTRGPGEMKLEVDRRVIEKRIHTLEEKIIKLRQQRATQRERRGQSQTPTVAIVGYTNAGKSTLLNALTGSTAFAEDKLFATLDTTTRRGKLPSGMEVTFTDTVGFINRLPTQLAAAFRATLEEVQFADFLLHVVDASSERAEDEISVTRSVLKDLGAGNTPSLLVWNKYDLVQDEYEPAWFERKHRPSAVISAANGERLDEMLDELEKLIDEARPQVWLRFGYDEFKMIHPVETHATVHKSLHLETGIYLLASLSPEMLQKYEVYIAPPPELNPPGEIDR